MSTRIWDSHAVSAKQLDKQMLAWEFACRQRQAAPASQRPTVEDFICISRQVGAGGRAIATLLGERLGWAVFDQQLLHLMAGDDAVRERIYTSMDERDVGWFEQAARSLMDPKFARNDYFHRLTETVLTLARQGHAVFLGRGAAFMLPSDAGFRVRIVAPLDKRLAEFARKSGLSSSAAGEEITRLERERNEFVWAHFHKRVDDPLLHDLTLNVARLTPARAVEVILSARTAASRP